MNIVEIKVPKGHKPETCEKCSPFCFICEEEGEARDFCVVIRDYVDANEKPPMICPIIELE